MMRLMRVKEKLYSTFNWSRYSWNFYWRYYWWIFFDDHGAKKQIVKIGVEAANGKIPVIVGVGDNNTRIAVELAKEAEKSGTDGVLAFLPHYPKPTQEGLYEHYKAIAKAISIPVGAYNWPAQYGINIEPETINRLAEEGYIQLLKDTVIDLDHTAEIIRLTKGKITI